MSRITHSFTRPDETRRARGEREAGFCGNAGHLEQSAQSVKSVTKIRVGWFHNRARHLPKLIVIVGPTAVGKTRLTVRLGEELSGEIVSADSRQIYRGLDIGTAKPTARQQGRAPHHLIDIIDPDEKFTLALYQEMACAAIDDVLSRGKVPLLVGGSGLYVRAVVENWAIPRVEPDERLRAELYRQAEEEGAESLHARLREVDPVAAKRIEARNVRRVVRALEVYLKSGVPISRCQGKRPAPYRSLQIGLTMERAELYRRIDRRVDNMIEAGLVEEVRSLMAQGYSPDLAAMSGLGYGQIVSYLRGEIELEEAIQRIKHDTHRFVRQQYNWFRLNDERIRWFDALSEPYQAVRACVVSFLNWSQ